MICPYMKECSSCNKGKFDCTALNPPKRIMDTSLCDEPVECPIYSKVKMSEEEKFKKYLIKQLGEEEGMKEFKKVLEAMKK